MRRLIITTVAALGATGAAAASAMRPQAHLTLKAAVVARGGTLSLAEVADCAGAAAVCAEIYGVEVPAAALGGDQAGVTEVLRSLVAREWPDAEVTIADGTGMRVAAVAPVMEAVEPAHLLQSRINELLGQDSGLEVEVVRFRLSASAGGAMLPAGCDPRFPEVEGLGGGEGRGFAAFAQRFAGTRTMTVACGTAAPGVTGPAVGPFRAQVTMSVRQLVPVAGRDLPRGTVLAAGDLTEDWITVGHGQPSIAAAEAVTGRRLRRAIAAGSAFTATALEVPVLVRRGQVVQLRLSRGNLAVQGRAQANGSGAAGQVIEATSMATRKRIKVRVVDSETVEYVF